MHTLCIYNYYAGPRTTLPSLSSEVEECSKLEGQQQEGLDDHGQQYVDPCKSSGRTLTNQSGVRTSEPHCEWKTENFLKFFSDS